MNKEIFSDSNENDLTLNTVSNEAQPSIDFGKAQEELKRATEYRGRLGKTALELLEARTEVITKNTDWGRMVTGINGLLADETKEFWAFLVNQEMAQEGAETYQTKNEDTINWELTEFDPKHQE